MRLKNLAASPFSPARSPRHRPVWPPTRPPSHSGCWSRSTASPPGASGLPGSDRQLRRGEPAGGTPAPPALRPQRRRELGLHAHPASRAAAGEIGRTRRSLEETRTPLGGGLLPELPPSTSPSTPTLSSSDRPAPPTTWRRARSPGRRHERRCPMSIPIRRQRRRPRCANASGSAWRHRAKEAAAASRQIAARLLALPEIAGARRITSPACRSAAGSTPGRLRRPPAGRRRGSSCRVPIRATASSTCTIPAPCARCRFGLQQPPAARPRWRGRRSTARSTPSWCSVSASTAAAIASATAAAISTASRPAAPSRRSASPSPPSSRPAPAEAHDIAMTAIVTEAEIDTAAAARWRRAAVFLQPRGVERQPSARRKLRELSIAASVAASSSRRLDAASTPRSSSATMRRRSDTSDKTVPRWRRSTTVHRVSISRAGGAGRRRTRRHARGAEIVQERHERRVFRRRMARPALRSTAGRPSLRDGDRVQRLGNQLLPGRRVAVRRIGPSSSRENSSPTGAGSSARSSFSPPGGRNRGGRR